MSEATMQVGTLSVPVGAKPRACGIHGNDTTSGRCEACDAAVAAVKVGAIFYTSWGYDQTNVDFYEVTERRGRATVVVREIAGHVVDGRLSASPGAFVGEPMTKRLRAAWREGTAFKIASYADAYEWDGTPKYDTIAAGGAGH